MFMPFARKGPLGVNVLFRSEGDIMRLEPQRSCQTFMIVVGAVSAWTLGASFSGEALSQQRETAPAKVEKHSSKVNHHESIANTKKKGFDGVDFSYDAFGAPSGQDPVTVAEQAKAKEMAEKPAVMAKQKQMLAERYTTQCRTQPAITMTNGKPQPIGPATQLKNGLTWEKLGGLEAEEPPVVEDADPLG